MSKIENRTPMDMANSLADEIEGLSARPTPRPWNRYQANENNFYLVTPDTEWPAFRHGKYFFHRIRRDDVEHCRVGLYLENGYDPPSVAGESLFKTNELRNESWVWDGFLADAQKSSLQTRLEKIEQALGHAPSLWFQFPGPGQDSPAYLTFRASEGSLAKTFAKNLTHETLPLAEAETVPDLARRLATNEALDMMWIDLFIGVELPVVGEPDDSDGALGTSGLWDCVFRHFLPWFARDPD